MALPYPAALALTLLVELPVWTFVGACASGASRGRSLAVGTLVNVVSHPVLWFALVPVADAAIGASVLAVLLAEVVVVIFEAVVAKWLLPTSFVTALCVSVIANGASWGLSLLLW